MADFTCASWNETGVVPSVRPEVGMFVYTGSAPPASKTVLVFRKAWNEPVLRGVLVLPALAPWLEPTRMASWSRFSSAARLANWYASSDFRPALSTASSVPEMMTVLRLIWT